MDHLKEYLKKLIILPILFTFLLIKVTQAAFLPPASAPNGMVVTSQHLATQVGVDILKKGGNAIDAAVAIGYALAVVHPCCGNLGGGGFMLIHRSNGKNIFINFRETAPEKIKSTLFFDKKGKVDKQRARIGYLPVGIPGTVMGLNTALKKYGTLSLKTVISPAIKLAEKGYKFQRGDINILNHYVNYFKSQPNLAKIFLRRGKPYQAGEKFIQKDLAHTLTSIGQEGSSVFYRGWIAKEIVTSSQKAGGVLSLKDFSNYHVRVTKPITCQYRQWQIITAPPPGSGTTVCEILQTLEGYDLQSFGFHSAMSIHLNAEAMRFAFADRNTYLGDPLFTPIPVHQLLSKQHIRAIRHRIRPFQAGKSFQKNSVNSVLEKPNTTHYSVVDSQGNAVSVTYTINGFFGGRVIAGKTGFFLNNELDDFTLKVGIPNQFHLVQGRTNLIAPYKQPLSSMSPTILMKNNQLFMVLGAAGGPTIITSIVQTIENVVDYKMNINTATNMPRFHMQSLPDIIFFEPFALSKDTFAKLHWMGYTLKNESIFNTPTWGQVASILYDSNQAVFTGANDNRYPAGAAAGLH